MFLSIVHLREKRCALCSAVLANAGSRSFIVDTDGNPVAFSAEHPPEEMQLEMVCENGHVNVVNVPAEAGAEESLNTPDDAPIGRDAVYKGEV